MDKKHTLLDSTADIGITLLVGALIFGAFRLLMLAYMVFTAVVWALFSELVWPVLRWTLRESGIALLRAYNCLTSFFA